MIIGIVLSIFVLYLIINAWSEVKNEEPTKRFTSVSYQLLFALVLSTIISITIALQADIPASSGHGGFVYIIVPALWGIGIFILYFISLLALPKHKFLLGLLGIMANVCVGLVVMGTDY